MSIKQIVLLIISLSVLGLSAQKERSTVFKSNSEGYAIFRIPAIVSIPNGDLLAFCEGRENIDDFGNVDIVMKRSSDRGKTWSKLKVLVDYGQLQAGNSAPVVDLLDPEYPQGRVFLFYNTGNNHEYDVRIKNGYREVWYITSTDGGHSWSEPTNITTMVHRPNFPSANPEYKFEEDWRTYANTPGHAMQFADGKYKGRLYVAANHSQGQPIAPFSDYFAHGYYSDDHGKTFHISESVNVVSSNESTAAQLSNDRLMLNSRNQNGDIRARIISISSDGGQTWDTTYFDNRLIDPVNQGSMLNVDNGGKKKIIAFCNAANKNQRNNLTLRISKDEGKTWFKNILIDKGDKDDYAYTAYSDIVKMGKRDIGVLYEWDNYNEIVFKLIKW